MIIGGDAALGVRPNTPVQLAHACLRAGYSLAVPGTWGDELIAQECVRQLAQQASATMVLCSCPLVRHRLLARGSELAPFMVSLVSPPVATARYVRAVAGQPIRVHYVGRCAVATDESIDRWIDPDDFVDLLESQGIDIAGQPTSFEGVFPPDRRRHWSLAGGFPTPEKLWESGGHRRRAEPGPDQDLADAVVEQLLSNEPSLIDLAPSLHCACSGVVTGVPPRTARARVALTEPPRSPSPVVDHDVSIVLAMPIDIAPAPPVVELMPPPYRPSGPYRRDALPGGRPAPEPPPMKRRPSGASTVRPSPTSVPVSRQSDGRLVPRAYAARRRATPASGNSIPSLSGTPDGEHGVESEPSCGERDTRDGDSIDEDSMDCEPRHSPALGITAQSG